MVDPIIPRHHIQSEALSERQNEAIYDLAKYVSRKIGDLKGRVTQPPTTPTTKTSKEIAKRIFKKEE